MSERIEIKKTPKLGSLKETLAFVKTVKKEELSYFRRLSGESAHTFLNTLKTRKYLKLVKDKIKKNEVPLLSPEITYKEQKYLVLRYGPPYYKIYPPKNIPTGFTVFTTDKNIVYDINKCTEICKLYKIWEIFYYQPIKISMSETLNNWVLELKNRVYDEILERKKIDYNGFIGSEEETHILRELDDEVYKFHDIDIEILSLINRLGELQFDLFESPSGANINELMQVVYRLKKLMPFEKEYLERRINVWNNYREILERKYKVKVNLDFNMSELGLAAFLDLMKYVLFDRKIPEAIIARVSIEVIKNFSEAKISEAFLNLIVHYGGLTTLEKQMVNHETIFENLNVYCASWETEIPSEMIRIP